MNEILFVYGLRMYIICGTNYQQIRRLYAGLDNNRNQRRTLEFLLTTITKITDSQKLLVVSLC